jgi:multicomponent Na+:H+ antiporter subunit B
MKWSALMALVFAGGLLVYSAPGLPDFGDASATPHQRVSPRYIEDAEEETHAPNMVTAVLADYRGFDTLFETSVILIAGLAVALILWPEHREREP